MYWVFATWKLNVLGICHLKIDCIGYFPLENWLYWVFAIWKLNVLGIFSFKLPFYHLNIETIPYENWIYWVWNYNVFGILQFSSWYFTNSYWVSQLPLFSIQHQTFFLRTHFFPSLLCCPLVRINYLIFLNSRYWGVSCLFVGQSQGDVEVKAMASFKGLLACSFDFCNRLCGVHFLMVANLWNDDMHERNLCLKI